MLVITRKAGQAWTTTDETSGHEILIRILSCTDGRVRVGIEAPREVHIVRDEIKEKPRKQA